MKRMSKRKRRVKKTVQKAVVPPITPTPPVTPEVQELMTQLVEKCTSLVYDLVECDCNERKDCQVFVTARDIARVLRGLTKVVPRRAPGRSRPTGVT